MVLIPINTIFIFYLNPLASSRPEYNVKVVLWSYTFGRK